MNYYTYRITNTKHNKHYYGSRQCDCNPKDDIGVLYFSSSTDCDFISDQKSNQDDYKYKVIRVYLDRQSALNMEIKLHNKFDVKNNINFYNKANQTSNGFTVTKEVGQKISKSLSGKSSNKKGKSLEDIVGKEKALKIKAKLSLPKTKEHRKKLSESHYGKKLSDEHKSNIGKASKGRVRTEEHRKKLSISKLNNHHAKDKTWEEIYGTEKAVALKETFSKSRIGKSKPLTDAGKNAIDQSNKLKRKVYKVELNSGDTYTGTKDELVNIIGCSQASLNRCLRNEQPTRNDSYRKFYNLVNYAKCIGTLRDFAIKH